MLATQPVASTSSLSSVSERPSLSMKTSHSFLKRSANLWLPLSPFPLLDDEPQGATMNDDKGYQPQINASPRTPSQFCWDLEEAERIEINDQTMKSVFEDWEDPLIPSSAVYIEKDGAQTLLITPQSAFFYPPPAPKPFGYEPFSKGLVGQESAVSYTSESQLEVDDDEDSESNGPILLTPKTLEHVSMSTPPRQPKGILFVDTTNNMYPSLGYSEWSATIFCSPKLQQLDEAASWAPRGFAYGPDVPLDCIYSAGDVSPVERWDEKLWSPVLRKGLRTAPCV